MCCGWQVDVYEKNIWSSAEYVHNHFIEGKDKAFYLAPDRINDAEVGALTSFFLLLFALTSAAALMSLLGQLKASQHLS